MGHDNSAGKGKAAGKTLAAIPNAMLLAASHRGDCSGSVSQICFRSRSMGYTNNSYINECRFPREREVILRTFAPSYSLLSSVHRNSPIPVMSGSWGQPITLRSELIQEPPSITEKNIPDLSKKVRTVQCSFNMGLDFSLLLIQFDSTGGTRHWRGIWNRSRIF